MKKLFKLLISYAIFVLAHAVYRRKRNVNDNNRLLVIDIDIPKFDQDAGSARMNELLKIVVLLGYKVTFISDSIKSDRSYLHNLRSSGINVISGRVAGLVFILRTKRCFKKIILSRPKISQEYIKYLRKFMPKSKIIYDSVDLHWVRLTRMEKVLGRSEILREAKYIKKIELDSFKSADLILAVSQDEKMKILNEIPDARVEIFPVIYNPSVDRSTFEESSGILFVGNFSHAPNEDAVLFFANEIFPLVAKAIPNVEFKIVGANMPSSFFNLKSKNIKPLGYVGDIAPLFKGSRLFVCPTRFGAGIKGKVIQSLSFGLPVVSTTIGIEGTSMRDGINCSVADDAINFAIKTVETYLSKAKWELYSRAGLNLVEDHYSTKIMIDNMKNILET